MIVRGGEEWRHVLPIPDAWACRYNSMRPISAADETPAVGIMPSAEA